MPFASGNALFGLTRLAVWWLRLGINLQRIKPGHPEQNGRHERMHRTLKAATAKPPRGNLSAQQRALLDLAIRSKLLIDSVDGHVFGLDSLVDQKGGALVPIVKERHALVYELQRLLRDLGLERRAKKVQTLHEHLAAKRRQRMGRPRATS